MGAGRPTAAAYQKSRRKDKASPPHPPDYTPFAGQTDGNHTWDDEDINASPADVAHAALQQNLFRSGRQFQNVQNLPPGRYTFSTSYSSTGMKMPF